MKHLTAIALRLLFLGLPTYCLNADQYCGDGIQTALGSFAFNGTEADDYWGNLCTNELGVLSMAASIKSYCLSTEITPGWQIIGEYCTENDLELPAWTDVLAQLTDGFLRSLQVVEFTDIDASKTWNASVLLSESLYKASYRTSVR
jgi:hypothetical protein